MLVDLVQKVEQRPWGARRALRLATRKSASALGITIQGEIVV